MGHGELPFIDEHAIVVERDAADVWPALLHVVERTVGGAGAARVARILGCDPVAASGPRPLDVGSTLPGFRVAVCEPERTLSLSGGHRFSRYALDFHIDELGPGRSRVRATTHAAFPGPLGRVYRALVIGTRGHVVAVRRMLGALERRAERAA